MIVVLQCAGTKRKDAPSLETAEGRQVQFVAKPQLAPRSLRRQAAHPDEASDTGPTWRDVLVSYNLKGTNPLGLLRAFELYAPPAAPTVYRDLVEGFGIEKVYILSAGWGLVRSDFLIPDYDITFAREVLKKDASKHRSAADNFSDFHQLPANVQDEIVFIGSKSYVRLFGHLTRSVRTRRTIYYNSSEAPKERGCRTLLFPSTNKRTWHYECAAELLHAIQRDRNSEGLQSLSSIKNAIVG